eukprot:CAMPEP_0181460266 /NCGR_PEP_ID=MMETSP1110-20121109/33251_1 /TAXON_ID=174948 /ORGANISM="Symbiodinium sp., Strain CCMP421" /LENGTH=138 /DNA_ID=CAMNT_0023584809 /DNA_START=143 /DNA_END=559 /DNA_ORIENTATION=-
MTVECFWGMGKCCTTKCNGPHTWKDKEEWGGPKTVTYSNCTIVEGQYTIDNDGEDLVVRSGSVQAIMAWGFKLPASKYACVEICDITYFEDAKNKMHEAKDMKIWRAGADEGDPPVCGFAESSRVYIDPTSYLKAGRI